MAATAAKACACRCDTACWSLISSCGVQQVQEGVLGSKGAGEAAKGPKRCGAETFYYGHHFQLYCCSVSNHQAWLNTASTRMHLSNQNSPATNTLPKPCPHWLNAAPLDART